MKGLVIWAHSYCRSVLAFYRGLGEAWNVPLKIYIWKKNATLRTKTGFKEDEFSDLHITYIGDDYESGLKYLKEHKDWHQIFCAYQTVQIYQKLIMDAKNLKCNIAIASEAPCNMSRGFKGFIKNMYMKYILPRKVKNAISASDFIINFSGDDKTPLEAVGWKNECIIPCGYYSPAITNSRRIKRDENNWHNFKILLTGIHQWHRSPMLLLKALELLNKKGLKFECDITQKGPLYDEMAAYIEKHNMTNVHLLGFLPIEKLIEKYESCSVYIGAGNHEPWGIRLNDALMCGAPLIINRGMGGHKMVKDYNCGYIFEQNDYAGLAKILENLIINKELYLQKAELAYNASQAIIPSKKAREIAGFIKQNFCNWI